MKIVSIFVLSLLQVLVFAQTNLTIKHIFYDLPLDKPRKEIQKAIKSDPRFKETRDDKDEGLLTAAMSSYLGACTDQGVVESKADSVEIELTFGFGEGPTKKIGKNKSRNLTFLKIRYFYSSSDSVETEYQRIVNLLRPILKDTSLTGVDTIYSDSPIRSQFKAKGMEFKSQNYSVEILNAYITKNYFGLFLEYECEEIKDDK